MGWEYDPTTGMGFYVDDTTGAIVTPVSTAGQISAAPIQEPSGSPIGIIVPTGDGWGTIPYSAAPYGIDQVVVQPAGPVLPGSPPLSPTTVIIPRVGVDIPGIAPIDERVINPYEPPENYPFTAPISVTTSSPSIQAAPVNMKDIMLILVIMEMTKERRRRN